MAGCREGQDSGKVSLPASSWWQIPLSIVLTVFLQGNSLLTSCQCLRAFYHEVKVWKKSPFPGAKRDCCGCRAVAGPATGVSLLPNAGGTSCPFAGAGSWPRIVAHCEPAVFQAAAKPAFSPPSARVCIAPDGPSCLPRHWAFCC